MAVGLVEAEDDAARDAVPVDDGLELVVAPAMPSMSSPRCSVGVEDVRAGGQLRAELGLEGGKELLCSLERLAHPLNLPAVAGGVERPLGSAP